MVHLWLLMRGLWQRVETLVPDTPASPSDEIVPSHWDRITLSHFSAGHRWVPMQSNTKSGIFPLLKVWGVLLKNNKGKVDA